MPLGGETLRGWGSEREGSTGESRMVACVVIIACPSCHRSSQNLSDRLSSCGASVAPAAPAGRGGQPLREETDWLLWEKREQGSPPWQARSPPPKIRGPESGNTGDPSQPFPQREGGSLAHTLSWAPSQALCSCCPLPEHSARAEEAGAGQLRSGPHVLTANPPSRSNQIGLCWQTSL